MVTITFLLYPSLSTAILLGSKCFHGWKENAYVNEKVKKKMFFPNSLALGLLILRNLRRSFNGSISVNSRKLDPDAFWALKLCRIPVPKLQRHSPHLDRCAGGDNTGPQAGAVTEIIGQWRNLLHPRSLGSWKWGTFGRHVHICAITKGLNGIPWREGR